MKPSIRLVILVVREYIKEFIGKLVGSENCQMLFAVKCSIKFSYMYTDPKK